MLLAAIALNGFVAGFALWRRSVTRSGAIAGMLVGSALLFFGGFVSWGMLMLFFVSASAISRVGLEKKKPLETMHVKGHERDAVQVLANAGVGAVCAIIFYFTREGAFLMAAAGSFAAANADTWASELGVLSPIPAKSIRNSEVVPAGMSGGVTNRGNLAALGGGLLIAIWLAIWSWAARSSPAADAGIIFPTAGMALAVVTIAGFSGSVVDSIFGAFVQALYQRADGTFTERRNDNGEEHTHVRGWKWVSNDLVNFACTLTGAVVAGGIGALLLAEGL
jgi:uncharacterized protein (TIGR00297 family)